MKPPAPLPALPSPDHRSWRFAVRRLADRGFTGLSMFSILLIALALGVILAPMFWRGSGAVAFQGTVEFRKLQRDQFSRGLSSEVDAEAVRAEEARRPVYEMLDRFKQGLDTRDLEKEAGRISLELSKQLEERDLPESDKRKLKRLARDKLRDNLLAAYQADDKAAARARLDIVLSYANEPIIRGTLAERYIAMARDYQHVLATVDLSKRAPYNQALVEVGGAVRRLFGPRPGQPRPATLIDQYGATRMDMAEVEMKTLQAAVEWVPGEPGQPLQKVEIPREEQFAGTDLEPLFPLLREHLDEMLLPRPTFYWQYFIDGSPGHEGHYFGGIGPEILGTLMLTALAMALAFPLGLISAAYLVEVARDTRLVRLIRTCINSLAGVPSIVFGLFGMAFFLVYLQPKLGLGKGSTILAGGLTLGLLVLPVMIRASEEAIRAVPHAYKEAALALGAGRLRCFVTVTLPAAMPGILTGVILSVSRAAGETAPILFTAAVAVGAAPWPPWEGLFRGTPALSYASYEIATTDKSAAAVPHNQYGMIMTLILLVLALNLVAIVLRWRLSRRLRGH
jgi:phosphate transport system permease protein